MKRSFQSCCQSFMLALKLLSFDEHSKQKKLQFHSQFYCTTYLHASILSQTPNYRILGWQFSDFHSHLQPYLCEASYILLEYARTAMFLWMFIEGLYLHNVVTVTVFQGRFPHLIYAAMGWGAPVLMTVGEIILVDELINALKLSVAGDMGWLHGRVNVESKLLVWVQFDALLLDS